MTHWSSRLLAGQLGISHSTVARVWAEHDVKPWQTEDFRFSSDPELEARVRDVVGLYLEPSAHAIVLCGDEKSQIQALERTPAFPPPRRRCPPATSARSSDSPGPVEGVADDRLGGGAAGLPTPQEGTPVKRSCTAVQPPVPRVAGQPAAVNDRGLLGAVNVLVRVHMVGAGGVEPPSSSAPAKYREPLASGRVRFRRLPQRRGFQARRPRCLAVAVVGGQEAAAATRCTG